MSKGGIESLLMDDNGWEGSWVGVEANIES